MALSGAVAAAALAAAGAAGLAPGASPLQAPTRWCGTSVAADQPDALSALQIHVLYAIPAEAEDRSGERVMPILGDLTAIESWWQAQDPARDLRFDLLTGGCDSTLGGLDLNVVRLPNAASYYADPQNGFDRLVSDIGRQMGYRSPDKKYLVYYDGPVLLRSVCGTSPRGPLRSGSEAAVVYLDSFCGDDLGSGGKAAATAVHELLHNLGAYPLAHPCAGSPGHACDDPRDILYPNVEQGVLLRNLRLDAGHDDYYALRGETHGATDVRDSPFLEHLPSTSAPPSAVRSLWATTAGAHVWLSWTDAGGVTGLVYRVYRAGELLTETTSPGATDAGAAGETIAYSVRAVDAAGLLGPPQVVAVRVGAGVVDETGALVRDTIPPPRVTGLYARRTPSGLVLTWNPVANTGDLAGYRVFRDGKAFGPLDLHARLRVARMRAGGVWCVAAVDRSGNVGRRSQPVAVR